MPRRSGLFALSADWKAPPQGARFTSSWIYGIASRFQRAYCLLLTALATGGCATDTARREPASPAEAKAVRFLVREVPAWSRENGCFSCHNNGDAARALYEAARRGYRVPAAALADTTSWVAQPAQWDHNKGEPGFSDRRLANLQFAASLLAAVKAGHVKTSWPLQQAARKVAADQDADGSWPIEHRDAAGSPVTYGAPLATYMALQTLGHAGLAETREAAQRAERWLRQFSPNNLPAAAALLLASARGHPGPISTAPSVAADKLPVPVDSAAQAKNCLDLIRHAQTREGGWGPYADAAPEPFDTALVLIALAEWRQEDRVKELIERGRAFLVAQQNNDGSWGPTTRPAGGDSYAQRLSTTGWAVLALLATGDSSQE